MDLDPHQAFVENLGQHIYTIWENSGRVYGTPQITALLAKRIVKASRKTVTKRVEAMAIKGIPPHAFMPATTTASKKESTLPDLVKRLFDVGELSCVWLNDTTYLHTGEGSLYLCVARDGHSRRVVCWAMDDTRSTDLVQRVLQMAYTSRGEIPEGPVFRAGRGKQYTRDQTWRICQDLGIIARSIGRTGVCFDNSMSESSWLTLKTEFYDRKKKKWFTRHRAHKAIAQQIEAIRSRHRMHPSLGM